jgi:thiosulfate/3-mercaptopyruvate sulfurtransferase
LEPWEKVLISEEDFSETVHGTISCTSCHAGQQSAGKAEAHTDLIARPSEDYQAACSECHVDITINFRGSLHLSQQGYWEAIEARSGGVDHGEMTEMFGNHCSSCHTTCGDCHVSQPNSVGGGLIDGHVFNATPSITRNCTACHGSRVGNEYLGKNEDMQADVHFRQARLSCVDCHDADQMHMLDTSCSECHDGVQAPQVNLPNSRYDGPEQVSCDNCHPESLTGDDGNSMHNQHGEQFQCHVCHSVAYTSCDSCHVNLSETTGNPVFQTAGSYLTFYIGRNPIQNYHRPYEYALLRHIPVDPESFSFYTGELLAEFNSLPTWQYATPHNIQLNTPQNESCAACHGNGEIFLTADKVSEEELEANQPVILEEVPNPFQ